MRKQAEEQDRRHGELSNVIPPSLVYSFLVVDFNNYTIGMANAVDRARKSGIVVKFG